MMKGAKGLDTATGMSVAVVLLFRNIMMFVSRSKKLLPQNARNQLLAFLATAVGAIILVRLQEAAAMKRRRDVIYAATKLVYEEFYERNNSHKRGATNDGDVLDGNGKKRRRRCRHDHERAWKCIQQDYLGPEPIFTDKQFEEVYRLTKGAVEKLMNACCQYEPRVFAHGRKDATGKDGIRVEVKVLGILKCIAFGCSGVAFRDYHQMAKNSFSEDLKSFFRAILADPSLRETYLRAPSRADAERVEALHRQEHSVNGLLLVLDCLHWYWKNCPVGQQCHYKNGKNKMSSVVMEAGCDYNTWIWHVSCGHPGTNNDINIWDVSDLQGKFLSDQFSSTVDFDFELDGQVFSRLWCLVDGIYPPLSRFVKTIPIPVGETMQRFVKWQESARKDIERAFGILVRKFQILARPSEYWYIEDIRNQMYGCVLMHNMMVEVRIDRNERDSENMYAVTDENATIVDDFLGRALGGQARSSTQSEEALQRHVQRNMGLKPPREYIESQTRIQIERWKALYDEGAHIELQTGVMNHIAASYIEYKESQCS